jgi:hypothetical protein
MGKSFKDRHDRYIDSKRVSTDNDFRYIDTYSKPRQKPQERALIKQSIERWKNGEDDDDNAF